MNTEPYEFLVRAAADEQTSIGSMSVNDAGMMEITAAGATMVMDYQQFQLAFNQMGQSYRMIRHKKQAEQRQAIEAELARDRMKRQEELDKAAADQAKIDSQLAEEESQKPAASDDTAAS